LASSKRSACKVVFGGNFTQVSQAPIGLQNLFADLTLVGGGASGGADDGLYLP
jgi:hypothetical protein